MAARQQARGGRLAAVVLALLLVAGCSSSGSDSGSKGGSGGLFGQDGVDVAAAEEPPEAGAAGSDSTLCALISPFLLPPEDLAQTSVFGDRTEEEQGQMLVDIGEALPDSLDADWKAVIESWNYSRADGGGQPPPDLEPRLKETLDVTMTWAREQCPGAAPSQRCWALAGEPYYESPLPRGDEMAALAQRKGLEPPVLAPTPEAVLKGSGDAAKAVELDRADRVVLYGWLDEDGFILRTQKIEQTSDGAGWVLTRKRACTS